MLQELKQIIYQGFSEKKVIVIGDLMLDKYMMGQVKRISPEAPVPIINVKEEKNVLGGSGNVALNLSKLDISVFLMGIIGTDAEGEIIKDILADVELSSDHILSTANKPTITKTRIVGEKQQILRIDKENTDYINGDSEAFFINNFKKIISANEIDAVIISDYAKGLITEKISRSIIYEANSKQIPVIVDPKGNDYSKYQNATILMPNEDELSIVCNEVFKTDKDLKKSARNIYKKLDIDHLVITRGAKGITLINRNYDHHAPARAREVFDVSGAGDTAIALVTTGLIMGLSIENSLALANLAAGYVVSKFGTHPISYSELNEVVHQDLLNSQKLLNPEDVENKIKEWKQFNNRIVFTNGCFDIIHSGHIHLLRKAKQEGDKLVVAVNSDESVRELKGKSRPINKLEDRVKVLEAFSFVDAIIPFSDLTPLRIIEQIKPDILVKGADYKEDEIVGAKEVKSYGGRVFRVPLIKGKSTTGLIKQVSKDNE